MWYHRPVSIERINPGELARPSGFSHAVSATGGRLVFLAGQTGYAPDGKIVPGGHVPQFERALRNLLVALHAADGKPSDLVSLTIYAVDLEEYRAHGREIGEAWRRLCGRISGHGGHRGSAALGRRRARGSAGLRSRRSNGLRVDR